MEQSTSTISGQDVADAFKADVEAFFHPNAAFALRLETGGVVPTCKGAKQRARIVLPNEMMGAEIKSFAEIAFALLVLGHETAHYLHRHNEHHDEEDLESRAIEMWADFYGTKIALVTLTFGTRINQLASALPGTEDSGGRADGLASALASLAKTYFSIRSPEYESAEVRVANCVAGMLSFFQIRYPMQALITEGVIGYLRAADPRVVVSRALGLQQQLYQNNELAAFMRGAAEDGPSSEHLDVISFVHQKIQADQPAMFQGMAPIPGLWLGLDYVIPDETRRSLAARNMQVLTQSLDALGIHMDSSRA